MGIPSAFEPRLLMGIPLKNGLLGTKGAFRFSRGQRAGRLPTTTQGNSIAALKVGRVRQGLRHHDLENSRQLRQD